MKKIDTVVFVLVHYKHYMRLCNTGVLMIVNKDGPERSANLATLICFQQNCMGVFARSVCSSHSYNAMRNVLCLIDARKTRQHAPF